MASNKQADSLEDKTRAELAEMAKDIPGIAQSRMSKEELVQAIRQNGKGQRQRSKK